MIETRHYTNPESGDVVVEAYAVVLRGEVASYSVRIPYIDMQQPDSQKRLDLERTTAQQVLDRMLRAHNTRG